MMALPSFHTVSDNKYYILFLETQLPLVFYIAIASALSKFSVQD
jgi:hypothetical protein